MNLSIWVNSLVFLSAFILLQTVKKGETNLCEYNEEYELICRRPMMDEKVLLFFKYLGVFINSVVNFFASLLLLFNDMFLMEQGAGIQNLGFLSDMYNYGTMISSALFDMINVVIDHEYLIPVSNGGRSQPPIKQKGKMTSWKEDLIRELNKMTTEHINELSVIVDRMGMDKSEISEWTEVVKEQIADRYKGFVDEARELQEKLLHSIEELLQQSQDLCKQLRIKMPPCGSTNLSLAQEKTLLKSRVSEYEGLVKTRMNEINALKKRQNDVCKSLGVEPILIPESPLPTMEDIDKFVNHIESLENERFSREAKFLEIKCNILGIVQELGIKPSLEIEKTICSPDDSLFLVTEYNMKWLNEYYDSLIEQKQQAENEISHLRETVCSLWEKLDEDLKVKNEFLEKHVGNSLATLEAFRQEVKRCEHLKKANIEKFIKTMRQELMSYWDKCHFSAAERESFEYFNDNLYTEDLLMFHEIEVDKMKKYYETNKETLMMLERREEYWKRKTELEDRENDPNRYKNRGGTLLKEEKERNGLTKKLREMELVLLEAAKAFEEENNRPFLSWGRTIPDIIEKTREDYEITKKQQLSAKKQQRNLTPTPVKSGILGSMFSGSKRNLLTLTPAPSTPSSCKRKLPPTHLFSSSKKKTPVREVPVLKVNDKTLVQQLKGKSTGQKKKIRYSHERKKRMEKIRRLSKLLNDKKKSSDSMDYKDFEKSMIEKSSCRSTLFKDQIGILAEPLPSTSKSPSTPRRPGTLARTHTYTKLKTAPGLNLDI
ncbi:hypothetical protein Trydic_g23287 [Trypoxylus dichotomus]